MNHFIQLLPLLALAGAQQVGYEQAEVQPKLQWKKCSAPGACKTVSGTVTADADWRWLHKVNDFTSCYQGNQWDETVCNSVANCTENCALEGGLNYEHVFGVTSKNDAVSLRYKTKNGLTNSVNNRVFLLGADKNYQTFTLLNNEFAFDVELSSVECGLNSALYFVAMDADGGKSKFPTNKAGAEYGTGYCDATCSRGYRFVGGKANYEGWTPDPYDPNGGYGGVGACCAEFDVWNSNAHSFTMSSKPCIKPEYNICHGDDCDQRTYGAAYNVKCDAYGCDYNPYRLGHDDFYGKGKKVDTTKKFTVVTQFRDTGITQYFVQNGKKIERPAPVNPKLGKTGDLNAEYCDNRASYFDEVHQFAKVGGWRHQNEYLRKPMVLTLAISHDYWSHNLWLDSYWPIDADPSAPGVKRGDCSVADHEPSTLQKLWPEAKVAWSNIRFGPIGSTVA